jgi:uncharacterized protein YdhG (YjbR/CyaY superfamily)
MNRTTISPQDYFDQLEPGRKDALETLRGLIFEVDPEIKETMRYKMPTYELDEVVVAMASQKHYISVYLDVDLVEKHKSELSHLNCGKSCVRFKAIDELPLDTVKVILQETLKKQKKTK